MGVRVHLEKKTNSRHITTPRTDKPITYCRNDQLSKTTHGRQAYQQVLRLDVSVTHTDAAVNVSEGAADLIRVQLHVHKGHSLIHAIVVLGNTIHSLGHVLQNQVQIKLIFIGSGKEAVLQSYNVGVVQQAHDLQLSVLVPFVLENLFDGHSLTSLDAFGLPTKGDDCG